MKILFNFFKTFHAKVLIIVVISHTVGAAYFSQNAYAYENAHAYESAYAYENTYAYKSD